MQKYRLKKSFGRIRKFLMLMYFSFPQREMQTLNEGTGVANGLCYRGEFIKLLKRENGARN